MPIIKLTLELCPSCHPNQTEDIIISCRKKYVEIPNYSCSNCINSLASIKQEVLVGHLNGAS